MSKYRISATIESGLGERQTRAAARDDIYRKWGTRNTYAVTVEPSPGGDEMRDHALNQIQTIAHDGVCYAEDPAIPINQTSMPLKAKLERIANIAEAGEPDEDWPAAKEVFDALDESVSGEELMAEREPADDLVEAGEMSTSDGLGASRRRPDRQILDEIAQVLRTVDSWTDPECGDLIAEKVAESGREPNRRVLTPDVAEDIEALDLIHLSATKVASGEASAADLQSVVFAALSKAHRQL